MRILDIFCGAGGAAMGYHQTWPDAEIIGIDNQPQPDYPFTFIQGDALNPPVDLEAFDFIHASPPCQAYSVSTPDKTKHPRLIEATRTLLESYCTPAVIENVPGAPISGDIMLCGTMFGLKSSTGLSVQRHRYFETIGWEAPLFQPQCQHTPGRTMSVVGNGTPEGNRQTLGRNVAFFEWQEGMQIDWCNRRGVAEAIPPAYTRWIAEQLDETHKQSVK